MKLFVHYLFRGLCILAGTVLFLSIPRLFYVEEKRLMFGEATEKVPTG